MCSYLFIYFIIDETKNPENNNNVNVAQYYLTALQYATDSGTGYRMTSIMNDGTDPVFTKEELLNHIQNKYPHKKDGGRITSNMHSLASKKQSAQHNVIQLNIPSLRRKHG